jgi:ADP-ribosylation factor protein 1
MLARPELVDKLQKYKEKLVKDLFPLESQMHCQLNCKIEARLLMLGLGNSGKTTILYKIKLNEEVATIPTIGFNVETLTHNNVDLTIWDVGGSDRIRILWRHYYANTKAIIYVVDCSDCPSLEESKEELWKMMEEPELENVPILIYANKCDLPTALGTAAIAEHLNLHSIKKRDWYIQAAFAKTGKGLFEGLDWII